MSFWSPKKALLKTTKDWLREGIIMGFNHAREKPDCTLESFLHDLDHLNAQLETKSTKELKQIVEYYRDKSGA